MTMLNALIGVGAGMAGLFALSSVVELTSTAPILALMLGLAVGIDYSLFITSRHRQNLLEGLAPEEAAGRAVGTAGSAVRLRRRDRGHRAGRPGRGRHPVPDRDGPGRRRHRRRRRARRDHPAARAARLRRPAGCCPRQLRSRPTARPRRRRGRRRPTGFGFRWARLVIRLPRPGHPGRRRSASALLALPAADMRLALPDAGAGAGRAPGPRGRRPDHRGLRPGLQRPPRAGGRRRTTPRRRPRPPCRRSPRCCRAPTNLLAVTPPQPQPGRADRAAGRHPEDRPDRRGDRDPGARRPRTAVGGVDGAEVALTGADRRRHRRLREALRRAAGLPAAGRRAVGAAADAGVPLDAGAAQGGAGLPAHRRRHLRHHGRGLPAGPPGRAWSAWTRPARWSASCRSC